MSEDGSSAIMVALDVDGDLVGLSGYRVIPIEITPIERAAPMGMGDIAEPTTRRGGCSNCGASIHHWPVVVGYGVGPVARWVGVPWLVRVWMWARSGFRVWPDLPGCGCLVKLKAIRVAIAMAIRYVRLA